MYSCTFVGIAVSAAQDLFEIATPATSSVAIHGLVLGQSSDYGDAQAEGLRIQLIRGHTTTGSGGATITPVQLVPGGAAASSTVKRNNTTVATGGSPLVCWVDVWNVQAGYQMWWPPESHILVAPSSRIVVTQTAPADEITMSGTLIYEALG